MKKNMSEIDRMIRLIAAAVIVTLFFTGIIEGTLALILMLLSFVLVVTSIVSFCPLYSLLGCSTCKNQDKLINKKFPKDPKKSSGSQGLE